MAMAADRDRISRAYVTDFEDVFEFGLPALAAARAAAASPSLAVTTLHMTFLAAFEDSHIARKHGVGAANRVRREAQSLARLWTPAATDADIGALLAFDGDLKSRGFNPGTTADFVVCTLFAQILSVKVASTLNERA
jgi:triphosphoribosyl-dephospho-CoA synthase